MANTTNYNWETPDDTDLVKDGAAAIRTLGNSIDTTTKNLNPETTTGDIAYRSATANTNTRLPIGTNGQILAVSAGVPAWINNDQGDITEVQAGTGISVASGTGPIPVVTNTVATAFDAKGDLIGGTGADTFAKLTVGANNTVLTADSAEATGLKWATPAGASFVGVSVNAASSFTQQTISNNTATALNMAAEYFDTNSFHDNSTNNTRLTVPSGKAGKYFIRANAEWASNGTGQRQFRFYKNGALLAFTQQPAVSGSYGMQLNYVFDLAAADYVEWYVLQTSGGNLDIYFSQDATAFTMYYLGA